MAQGSFGIECARLAGVPESILKSAQRRSTEMQTLIGGQQGIRRYLIYVFCFNAYHISLMRALMSARSRQLARLLNSSLGSQLPGGKMLLAINDLRRASIELR